MNVRHGDSPWSFFGIAFAFAFIAFLMLAVVLVSGTEASLTDIDPLITGLYRLGGVWGIVGVLFLLGGLFGLWGLWRLYQDVTDLRRPCPMSPEELMFTLTQTLHFTPVDLIANRQGLLSESQRAMINQMHRQSLVWSLVALFFSFFLFGLIGVVVLLGPSGAALQQEIQRDSTVLIALAGIGFIFALVMGASLLGWVVRWLSSRSQRVGQAVGRVRLRVQRTRYAGRVYILRIGWKRFYLTHEQLQGFWNGGRYRIYYFPFSPTPVLLAAEPIVSGD